MTSRKMKSEIVPRAEQSSRCLRLAALVQDFKPIEHRFKSAASAVTSMPGSIGAIAVRLPAFAIEVGESHAGDGRCRFGGDALGVRYADGGESGFVFRGRTSHIARDCARLVDHLVLPGMALPDGRACKALGASLLDRPGDPRAEALPVLPQWLAQWIGGKGWPADEPEPEATLEPAPSCATCASYDWASSECRGGPPTVVIGPSGATPGRLRVQPTDVCAGFIARTTPPPACRGCRRFSPVPGADGRRGLCRGSPPAAPLDITGRLTGRAGQWPSVPATAWCSSYEPAAESGGLA